VSTLKTEGPDGRVQGRSIDDDDDDDDDDDKKGM